MVVLVHLITTIQMAHALSIITVTQLPQICQAVRYALSDPAMWLLSIGMGVVVVLYNGFNE